MEREITPKAEKPEETKSGSTGRQRKNQMSKEFMSKSSLAEGVGRTTGYDRFESGDEVDHLTFGRGTILSVREMGADLLYEIAFDSCGTKKLMATYAKLRRA